MKILNQTDKPTEEKQTHENASGASIKESYDRLKLCAKEIERLTVENAKLNGRVLYFESEKSKAIDDARQERNTFWSNRFQEQKKEFDASIVNLQSKHDNALSAQATQYESRISKLTGDITTLNTKIASFKSELETRPTKTVTKIEYQDKIVFRDIPVSSWLGFKQDAIDFLSEHAKATVALVLLGIICVIVLSFPFEFLSAFNSVIRFISGLVEIGL